MKNDQLELLEEVKAAGEDFEWYPTTRAMLEVVAADLRVEKEAMRYNEKRDFSILDIGAGNGSALKMLCELTGNAGQKYAIEKSKILIDALPADVFIVGTDFHQQTLIDKQVDVIFCNPPYSEFQTWMRRIVAEANAPLVYMVVPERWKDDPRVMETLTVRCGLKNRKFDDDDSTRDGSFSVLGSATFENSEYRQARAKVDIIKIRFGRISYGRGNDLQVDPFDLWFDDVFAFSADKVKASEYDEQRSTAERLHDLVIGQNIIERLEELYRAEMASLFTTYKSLESIDAALLKELGADKDKIKGGLRSKLEGLKNLYWKELFGNLDAITSRLTVGSRKALLDKLTANTAIDYTASNAYAVVMWAIKNANAYFDQQLKEVYLSLADKENVRNYKSNKRLETDDWRYSRIERSHYTLDYRLVLQRYAFSGYDWELERGNGLSESAHDLLNDLCTVAKNLGFNVATTTMTVGPWTPGRLETFRMEPDGAVFMEVRAYLKGTIHLKVNQDFMRKLNIEAARLNGWVKSPKEAAEETGIEDARELFGTNFKLNSIKLLGDGISA